MLSLSHAQSVTALATRLADYLGLPAPLRERVQTAAYYHDVGQHIDTDWYEAIADIRLARDDALWAMIERHPQQGANLYAWACAAVSLPVDEVIRQAIAGHHRDYHGGDFAAGYPLGVPLEGDARIVAAMVRLCDSYCAATEDRPYYAAVPPLTEAQRRTRVLFEISHDEGRRYDPRLADAFLTLLEIEEPHAPRY